MKRLAWVTDIHLNFISLDRARAFARRVREAAPDVLLVGGDVAEAPSASDYLELLETEVGLPIYFVLGNHDFYRGSIRAVRDEMKALSERSRCLRWLPATGVVPLSRTTCLVGHDGWADGRAGDWARSTVMLNDYLLIDELVTSDKAERRRRLEALGDEAAAWLQAELPRALARHAHVVVLTHVPPFREACWHAGRISDDDWLPHFTCVAVGEVLRAAMQQRTDRRMTVLCGHTHGAGTAEILPNLRVVTGGARYGVPELQEMIVVE